MIEPRDAQFMAIRLEGGATGISFLLLVGAEFVAIEKKAR